MAYQVDQCYAMDQYGGFTDLPVTGGATGFFRIGQIGDRWTFVTPEGNAFLQKGIMVWNPVTARVEPHLARKYGGARTNGQYTPYNMIRAAKLLGINTVGWGATYPVLPESFLGSGRTVAALGLGFPMLPNHAPAQVNVGKGVKDILRSGGNDPSTGLCNGGVKFAAFPGAFGGNATRRAMVDFGDPNYTQIIQFAIEKRKDEFATGATGIDIAQSPWLLANAPDDADPLFGHKGGIAINPGWVCCITSPMQKFSGTESAPGNVFGVTAGASQPEVYGKSLARDYLRNKYGTIQQLNASWGSTYTTFDSSNPADPLLAWQLGTGTGFMDEDGVTHQWMKINGGQNVGAFALHYMCDLRYWPTNVRLDMEAILEQNVEILYRQYESRFRAEYPNHLLMSPSALKHDLGFYKPGVLRAAGRVFDYLQMDYNPTRDNQPAYFADGTNTLPTGDTTASLERSYNLSGKPIVAWQSALGMPDSAAWRLQHQNPPLISGVQGNWGGDPRMSPSQEGKGGLWTRHMDDLFGATGADGKKFWLGFDNWNPWDQHNEGNNWGFMTEQDNAYDGRQTERFGVKSSPIRRQFWLLNRSMITDETGHPVQRWVGAQTDNQLHPRARYGDSTTLIRAATRSVEFRWLSLVGAEEPVITGRTGRHGGRARVGGRVT